MFYHSKALDILAQKKCDEGCRAIIKKMAHKSIITSISHKIVSSMDMIDEMGYMKAEHNITMVHINQCLLVFQKTLAEVQEFIENTHSEVRSVPDKVLVKMASLRLISFMKSVKKYDGKRQKLDMEIKSISKFVKERDINLKEYGKYAFDKSIRNLEKFTSKKELKDEHISQGWDLYIVDQIMKE